MSGGTVGGSGIQTIHGAGDAGVGDALSTGITGQSATVGEDRGEVCIADGDAQQSLAPCVRHDIEPEEGHLGAPTIALVIDVRCAPVWYDLRQFDRGKRSERRRRRRPAMGGNRRVVRPSHGRVGRLDNGYVRPRDNDVLRHELRRRSARGAVLGTQACGNR